MPSLILLRGLPGSGKSTLAKVLSGDGTFHVLSIDNYFTDDHGVYHFEFSKNHLAYKACEDRACEHLQRGTEKVFVDNTFTLEWEMEPYFKMAAEFGYHIFVVTVENRHNGKNIHNIPEEQISRMREKYRIML